jgi:hypothetical protein
MANGGNECHTVIQPKTIEGRVVFEINCLHCGKQLMSLTCPRCNEVQST